MTHIYDLTYALSSDVRIGHRKIGNLHTTRYYVPGWTLWASCVNRLKTHFEGMTYSHHGNPWSFWEDLLKRHVKFSYFFIKDEEIDKELNRDLKRDSKGARQNYQKQNIETIERHYIGSTVGTALAFGGRTADPGSLNESEWILACSRKNRQTQIQGNIHILEGRDYSGIAIHVEGTRVVFSSQDRQADFFNEILNELYVGGDISSGKGRIKQVSCQKVALHQASGKHAGGHVFWSEQADISGELEAVTLRMYDKKKNRPGGRYEYFLAWQPWAQVNAGSLEMDCWGRMHWMPGTQDPMGRKKSTKMR